MSTQSQIVQPSQEESVATNPKESSAQPGLMSLLKPHRPSQKQFALMALLVLVATGLELFIPLFSKYMIDTISTTGVDYTLVATLVIIVLAAAIAEGLLAWYGSYLGEKTNFRLRFSVFRHLLHSRQTDLNQEHSAELSARVVNDSMAVKSILAEDLIGFVTGLVSIVSVVAIMFYLDWRLTLVLVSCILIGVLLITPLAVSMRGIGMAMQEAEAQLIANVTEWLRSSTTIKVHNASDEVLENGKTLLDNAYFHAMRQARVMALIGPISNLILMVSMIAILASSAVWLAEGSLTLGTVTAFMIYLFGLAFPIMAIGMFLSNLHRASGAATRLNELLQLRIEQLETGEPLQSIDELEVSNLHYKVDEKSILKDINWTFKPNKLTVLSGESGSGKSSLIQQLVGLYSDTFESILINGKPLSSVSLSSLRHHVAWLEQSPSLFLGSVRDNLTLGLETEKCETTDKLKLNEETGSDGNSVASISGTFTDSVKVDDETLKQALIRVGLGKWLEKNDFNLDMQINENTQQFSGGEKQRFALARAIIRKPQVLILDEPTSALDKQTEAELMGYIRELTNEMRVIMVTHNKSLIQVEDDVIELEEGSIKAPL